MAIPSPDAAIIWLLMLRRNTMNPGTAAALSNAPPQHKAGQERLWTVTNISGRALAAAAPPRLHPAPGTPAMGAYGGWAN